MVRLALLIDPRDNRLTAVGAFQSDGNKTFLFGPDWGRWIDENGRLHFLADVPQLLRRLAMPIVPHEAKREIECAFQINIHYREIFSRTTLLTFRDGPVRHRMHLSFGFPMGDFRNANLHILHEHNDKVLHVYPLDGFPLLWPHLAALRVKPAPTETPQPVSSANDRPATPAPPPRPARPAEPVKADPPAEPKRPVPRTEHVSTHELISILSTETDGERRWQIIEPNLMRGRPERTYPLILNYSELIAERTHEWPAARLKVAFANQPGAVLIHLMHQWRNNQVLALADENADSDKMLQWLREREIDRLLALNLDEEIISVDAARRALNIDRSADASEIKRIWRTLLGFLNMDLGRRQERAIHRKKDEIAKHLQDARNVLLKSMPA